MEMKILNSVLGIVIFGLLISCGSGDSESQKIAFMENAKVFQDFDMKKDYDKIMESEMKSEAALIDSITVLLNGTLEGGDSLKILQLKRDYYTAEKIFNEKFDQLSSQYTKEVNDRLNGYIKEYSKEKGYSIILGSGGEGNVMFVDDVYNITDELIKYSNEKYSK